MAGSIRWDRVSTGRRPLTEQQGSESAESLPGICKRYNNLKSIAHPASTTQRKKKAKRLNDQARARQNRLMPATATGLFPATSMANSSAAESTSARDPSPSVAPRLLCAKHAPRERELEQ